MKDNKDNDLLKMALESQQNKEELNITTEEAIQNTLPRARRNRNFDMGKGNRVPLYDQKAGRFKLPVTPGFVGRVIIDEGDRINQFTRAGWRIVESTDDSMGEGIEGRSKFGSAIRRTMDKNGRQGVLMEISKELFEQDMKAKRDRINRTTKDISTAEVKGNKYYGGVTFGDQK